MNVDRFRASWTDGTDGLASRERRTAGVPASSRRPGWCCRDVSVPLDLLKAPGAPTLDDYLTSVAAPPDAVRGTVSIDRVHVLWGDHESIRVDVFGTAEKSRASNP
jgi:hypothetical protein